jgi:hypothetical protein
MPMLENDNLSGQRISRILAKARLVLLVEYSKNGSKKWCYNIRCAYLFKILNWCANRGMCATS